MAGKRYCIRTTKEDGSNGGFLSHRGKTEFCRRTALKYMREWTHRGTLELILWDEGDSGKGRRDDVHRKVR